ncbi:MAG TPA: LuxR C-terminal-related transcriptional regulator [Povalibacter sp.]|nr:LuxR C-terminal-related transcriptional regulator [Povalibacter sp.]
MVALTKFRAPRVRRDVLTRPVLLDRLARSIDENPVTLVCAPGGSGKTTLLAQWISDPPPQTTALWITIDADDNDTNRFFAALIQALEPLELTWDTDPRALAESVASSRAQMRAALAALVNALCTSVAPRIVLIFDDLHRIEKTEGYELLDSLIERLPDHVTVVLGTRVEPPLSLARWRAYGELGAFTPADLQFSVEDAVALAQARFGKELDESAVREAMQRTQGWAAGLLLVLQSRANSGAGSMTRGDGGDSNRHLFAYLAQEVLDELPPDLQDFVLRSSILIELNPHLCSVLTRRSDARQVLESLYRRNLFLTAIDEMAPVLRFHDLFREFLEAELARRDPQLKRELHELTAQAERMRSRAIYHLLAAQRWDEAMERIADAAPERLAHGGIATVERWIDAIPDEVRAGNAVISYLRGTCAWFRLDWPRTRRELTVAVDGLTAPEHNTERVSAMFHLIDALNSSGARAEALDRVEQVAQLPLDPLGKAEIAILRSWCATPSGDQTSVALYMRDYIEVAAAHPAIVLPATADRIHCVQIGIPGIAGVFDRFAAIFQQLRGTAPLPWHISAVTISAWAHLWRGRRAELMEALSQADVLQHQFGGFRLATERLAQVRSISGVVLGQQERSLAIMHAHIEALQTAELAGHGAVWLRGYRHALARAYWILGNAAGLREVLPHLVAPLRPGEWPFNETAAAIVRGHDAIFAQDWRRAETALREALVTFPRYRMPMIFSDARIGLAYAVLMQGRRSEAWSVFEPAYEEVVREHAIGLLLLEPRAIVNALLDIVPPVQQRSADHAVILESLGHWGVAAATDVPVERGGLLAVLSERELEVLGEVAGGASNKHIARSLSLSLHTVKRHIANILDKLDCDSRGQAADLFRRHS